MTLEREKPVPWRSRGEREGQSRGRVAVILRNISTSSPAKSLPARNRLICWPRGRRLGGGGGRQGQGRQDRRGFGPRGKGVEGGRRGPEEVALGVAEIGAVLQGPDLGNKGRQGVAGTGRLIVGEPGLAGGLLDSQLGALLVAEEFVGLLALAAEGRDGGAVGPREMDCEDSRSGHHGDQQDEDRGEEAGDARVTAAPAAEVLDGGDATGEDGAAVEEAVEVVGQRVGVGVAAVGLLLEALQADRLQVARYLGLEPRRRHRLLGADLLDRVGRRRSPEGRSAREQFVEDGAEGVLVDEGAGVMGLAAGLLGGHVVGRTDDGAGYGSGPCRPRGVWPGRSR